MKDKTVKHVLGIPVHALYFEETVDLILSRIDIGYSTHHLAINAWTVVNMLSVAELKESVNSADIVSADGMSIVWASQFLGNSLPERVTGIDLMMKLVELAYQKGYKCYFLGARQEVVKKVVSYFSRKYSNDMVAGYRNGYFDTTEIPDIVNEISLSGAHLVFVALAAPDQHIFINRYKNEMKVPFVMGVGGSFDVIAGVVKRAPIWMQKSGLEWLYRLFQSPRSKWKRNFYGNVMFIWLVLKAKFGFKTNFFETSLSS